MRRRRRDVSEWERSLRERIPSQGRGRSLLTLARRALARRPRKWVAADSLPLQAGEQVRYHDLLRRTVVTGRLRFDSGEGEPIRVRGIEAPLLRRPHRTAIDVLRERW